jgi:SET domain-containing protein
MLLVRTTIGPSTIHGIGIFAAELIPAGTRIWEYREGVDSRFDSNFLQSLPRIAQDQLLNYSYRNPRTGLYVLCGDDARFFNHSDTPNTDDLEFDGGVVEGEGITVAARDILPGEEIVSNYHAFDATTREWGLI